MFCQEVRRIFARSGKPKDCLNSKDRQETENLRKLAISFVCFVLFGGSVPRLGFAINVVSTFCVSARQKGDCKRNFCHLTKILVRTDGKTRARGEIRDRALFGISFLINKGTSTFYGWQFWWQGTWTRDSSKTY